MERDTIYALASAPGRSGVAVLRVSGAASRESFRALLSSRTALQADSPDSLSSRSGVPPDSPLVDSPGRLRSSPLVDSEPQFTSHVAQLCTLRVPGCDEVIDQALVLFFENPKSYTGEDVVEYHLHGSQAVLEQMYEVLVKMPHHRMAEPGEFTRRAFENGKMDLTGAEAVADLIDAQTAMQKTQALQQMGGALSDLYEGWTDRLKKSLAHLEADIEFPDEDDVDGTVSPALIDAVKVLSREIADHLDDNRKGERLRDGIQIAVIGAPNAGKSSLVNALAQRDVAIVSDMAGTTRDVIEAHLNIGGYAVILADTAGLRPDQLGQSAQDSVESEGIRRAMERAESADLKLLVFDGAETELDPHTLALIDDNALVVVNKADGGVAPVYQEYLQISAKSGAGLQSLTDAILERVKALVNVSRETFSLTRARHREALVEAQTTLLRALDADLPELMAEDMRLAIRSIGRITGRVDVEDLLDVIFNDFCIGK